MTEGERGWAAGIIDGEGCIRIYVRSRKGVLYQDLRLTVVNTSAPMLLRLKAYFGGSIYRRKKRSPNHRSQGDWQISGKTAAACLAAVLPWLLVKRPEALLAIEFVATLMQKKDYNANSGMGAPRPSPEVLQRREEIRQKVADLKHVEYSFN